MKNKVSVLLKTGLDNVIDTKVLVMGDIYGDVVEYDKTTGIAICAVDDDINKLFGV